MTRTTSYRTFGRARACMTPVVYGIALTAFAFSTPTAGSAEGSEDTAKRSETGDGTARRPNFVIIVADDLGYGDLSSYGGWIRTPHLDRLAQEGLRFTDFHSNGAVCSPTRAALMTGRYQQRAGLPAVVVADPKRPVHFHGLQDVETTLPEALRAHGYRTAIFGKWHLGYLPKFNPTRHGFEKFRGYVSGNVDFISHVSQAGEADWWEDDRRVDEEGYVTHLITRHAVRFLESVGQAPFFLYLPHEAPHYPYQGPRDVADRTVGGKFPNHGSRKDKKAAYREMVEELDKGVGEVIAKLRELKLAQNTLVLFFSDNGATRLGSNGALRGHKGSVWEGGHRVPAIAWWPGRIRAGVSAVPAMTMDVFPTLLGLADLQPDAARPLDGVDLSPLLLDGKKLPPRRLFWQHRNDEAVRDGPWKLIRKGGDDSAVSLYRLDQDAAEKKDIAGEHADERKRLLGLLDAWRRDVENGATPQP